MFQARFRALDDAEKLDLAVTASNTTLHKLIALELAELNTKLANQQIPPELTLESCMSFCLRYKEMQEQREWLESLATTLREAAALLDPNLTTTQE